MPNRTLYVRNEDIEVFDELENKPEWLHQAIQNYVVGKVQFTTEPLTEAEAKIDALNQREIEAQMLEESVQPAWPSSKAIENGLCKVHGTPLDSRGKCLQKGCKYA